MKEVMRDIPVNGLLRFGILAIDAICANVDENSTNGDPLAKMVKNGDAVNIGTIGDNHNPLKTMMIH